MERYLPLVAAALIAAFAAWLVVVRERRYRESLRDAARGLGLAYEPRGPALDDIPFMQRIRGLRWRRRAVRHSCRGSWMGHETWFFEYGEHRSTGRSHHVRHVSVVAFRGTAPEFQLRPAHAGDRILEKLGHGDIDFDHAPEFSRAFTLRGPSEDAVRRLFTPELMRTLLEHRGWMIDASDGWVAFRRGKRRVKPEELGEFLREAARLRDLVARD